ncbi:MAG: hypothetical protein JRI91_16590 [Deltaproteobacteria bacterium]|nr:hypothetical protein [Deltaproteobacteria bacterium]
MQSFLKISILVMLFLVSIFSTSSAQIPWTKDANNPVMSGSGQETWDKHLTPPCVLYNPDSEEYEMWFGATLTGSHPFRVGFAISYDGISWSKYPHPVLEPDAGAWDESTVYSARVIRENGQYKMWYAGWSPSEKAGGIGYATSPDGINWTKNKLNPVFPAGSSAWEAGALDWFCVLPVQGGGYKMWYTAYNAALTKSGIGYATSVDGMVWQTDTLNNPVFTSGITGQWDEYVFNPHVLFLDGVYHMFYEGRQSSGNPRKMGWATSGDGIHWNKYNDPNTSGLYAESDPVLTPSSGQWDGNFIEPGTVMLEGDSLRLWYSGNLTPTSTNLWRVGHATAPFDSITTGLFDMEDIRVADGYILQQNYPCNKTTPIHSTQQRQSNSLYPNLNLLN